MYTNTLRPLYRLLNLKENLSVEFLLLVHPRLILGFDDEKAGSFFDPR